MSKARQADNARRHFLRAGVGALAVVGTGLAAWPFLQSWRPSARARAAGEPVVIDPSKIEPGQQVTLSWRGKPIFVLRRTESMISELTQASLLQRLRDPDSEQPQQPEYAGGPLRSRRRDLFVAIGLCTHLGCVPNFHPETGDTVFATAWTGGYFCPCHGSKFDLAGRVFRNVPAPLNLAIPPHYYGDSGLLIIGQD